MMEKDEVEQLYQMVQEAKLLLMRWRRSGAPRNNSNKELRRDTNAFMKQSSSRVYGNYLRRKAMTP